MLYYITYTHIPTKKAFGYAIAKMCSSFAAHSPVTLVIPRDTHKEIVEDMFDFYSLPRNFSVIELPCVDLFRYTFLGKHIPFIIRKVTFAISVLFHLKIEHGDVCYSRDLWSLFLLRLKSNNLFLEIHYLSKIDAISIRLAHIAKKIIVITSYLKKELVGQGHVAEAIVVAPDAVDLSEYEQITQTKKALRAELRLPADQKIVVYSGNLFAWKGVYTLVDAFEKVPAEATLVIVGGSDDTLSAFTRYVSAKPYAQRIMILGYRRHQEIARYLMSADILVIPNSATEHISKYNTSPLKLFEYMASGVPILASDLPSMREVLSEESAVFVRPDDPASLAEGIRGVIRDPGQAEQKAIRARTDVNKYTWKARAANIVHELYS